MLKFGFAVENCRKMLTPTLPHMADQIRTTYILKRKWAPQLDKQNRLPKPLKTKNFVYDLVEHVDSKKEPNLELILTNYVEGIGMKGDVVSVRPHFGRHKLLLQGLAIYASPENLKKFAGQKSGENIKQEFKHSSRFSELTRRELARQVLCVAVNKENPWTIEKWHIRAAFRRAGFWVPDHAITMGEKTISGPDPELEGKQFLVTVTINNLETTPVRCRIHHWSTEVENRLPPSVDQIWTSPAVPLFEEEATTLSSLPQPSFKSKTAKV